MIVEVIECFDVDEFEELVCWVWVVIVKVIVYVKGGYFGGFLFVIDMFMVFYWWVFNI